MKFEYQEKSYIGVKPLAPGSCKGCAFLQKNCDQLPECESPVGSYIYVEVGATEPQPEPQLTRAAEEILKLQLAQFQEIAALREENETLRMYCRNAALAQELLESVIGDICDRFGIEIPGIPEDEGARRSALQKDKYIAVLEAENKAHLRMFDLVKKALED